MVLIKAIVFYNSHGQATAFMIIIVSTQDYNVARYIIPGLALDNPHITTSGKIYILDTHKTIYILQYLIHAWWQNENAMVDNFNIY